MTIALAFLALHRKPPVVAVEDVLDQGKAETGAALGTALADIGAVDADSVVNVTQIATIDRMDIGSVAGRLSRPRLAEIWSGVRLVLEPSGV